MRGRAALTDVKMAAIGLGEQSDADAFKGHRDVNWQGGAAQTAVYDGTRLAPGSRTAGPAIIEFPDTTVVIDDQSRVEIHASGSVVIDLVPSEGAA